MWLNCTRTKVNSDQVAIVLDILGSEPSLAPIRRAPGFCNLYLVESTEIPGELISITIWDCADDGQAYLASPACQEVIEGIQGYLVRPLERGYYRVLFQSAQEIEKQCT
jgi:quinol monooxygenase YgiN